MKNSPKEPQMTQSSRIAVVVSAFVSVLTVSVFMLARPDDGGSNGTRQSPDPELAKLSSRFEKLSKQIDEMRDVLRELERRVPDGVETLRTRLATLEVKLDSDTVADAARSAESAGTPKDPAELIGDAEELFTSLTKGGYSAYGHPKMTKLADMLGELEDGGRAFVLTGLSSEDPGERFVAAALAEKLKDPELIDDLEIAAIEDSDFMVRRMSSHALAFMNSEDTVGSLVKIIENETRDPGVAVNAWFGLANLKRPEAASTFERVLDRAGGDVPADVVVATALKNSDPALLPSLRLAYDKESVSNALKTNILRTLAKVDSGEYEDFVRRVANDASAAEELRTAARESLDDS